jgi:hypothetical protein
MVLYLCELLMVDCITESLSRSQISRLKEYERGDAKATLEVRGRGESKIAAVVFNFHQFWGEKRGLQMSERLLSNVKSIRPSKICFSC